MNNQYVNVYYRAKSVTYQLNFPENGETAWPFTAEFDSEIYNIETNNIASFQINGNNISLPFTLSGGNSYSVSITKNTSNSTASISFSTRQSANKINTINVPDYSAGDGRYLFVSSNGVLYKIDTSILVAANYSGSGTWSTSPIVGTYTMPDISGELDYNGIAGNLQWRSLAFVNYNGDNYIFIVGGSTTLDIVGTFFKTSDNNFYKTDFSGLGYTRLRTGYGVNSVLGGIIYNYVSQKLLITHTRGNSVAYYLLKLGDNSFEKIYGLGSPMNRVITQTGGYVYRNGFDPVREEYCSGVMRIKESESNRNYMNYANADGQYIKLRDTIITYNASIPTQRVEYDNNGNIVFSYGGTGSFNGNDGAITVDEINNYILGVSSSADSIWINYVDVQSGGINYTNVGMVTSDHNGFRGVMKSTYSGHAFSWGRIGTDSGKRLYVFDPSKRDSTIEVGYLDFVDEINDIHSNQIL